MSTKELEDTVFKEFISMENVIYTTHTAFYTDEAISNMIETSLKNLHEYETRGYCENEVIK